MGSDKRMLLLEVKDQKLKIPRIPVWSWKFGDDTNIKWTSEHQPDADFRTDTVKDGLRVHKNRLTIAVPLNARNHFKKNQKLGDINILTFKDAQTYYTTNTAFRTATYYAALVEDTKPVDFSRLRDLPDNVGKDNSFVNVFLKVEDGKSI
jgi:hypothetical protein